VDKKFLKIIPIFCILFFTFAYIISQEPEAYFSPQDNIEKKLIERINKTHKRVYAAIYMLTDKEIAQSLVNAKERGVDVQIITDQSCSECEFGKMKLLKDHGISVFVFKASGKKNKYQNELMHNKFALLDNQLCTGSFNWTISANRRNRENIIFEDNESLIKKFEKKFEELKKDCTQERSKQPKKQEDGRMYYVYKKLVDKTASFLKSIRDTLGSP
jgi:phosphatidylserine/phosphatidylglycerophosphate/cardiolipin synthase-like enzyme